MILIKTYYIKKVDKPQLLLSNIKKIGIEQDNCKIYSNLEKERNIKKVVAKIEKYGINNVVLEKELYKNTLFITKSFSGCGIQCFR